jgi:hypothetical protein
MSNYFAGLLICYNCYSPKGECKCPPLQPVTEILITTEALEALQSMSIPSLRLGKRKHSGRQRDVIECEQEKQSANVDPTEDAAPVSSISDTTSIYFQFIDDVWVGIVETKEDQNAKYAASIKESDSPWGLSRGLTPQVVEAHGDLISDELPGGPLEFADAEAPIETGQVTFKPVTNDKEQDGTATTTDGGSTESDSVDNGTESKLASPHPLHLHPQ